MNPSTNVFGRCQSCGHTEPHIRPTACTHQDCRCGCFDDSVPNESGYFLGVPGGLDARVERYGHYLSAIRQALGTDVLTFDELADAVATLKATAHMSDDERVYNLRQDVATLQAELADGKTKALLDAIHIATLRAERDDAHTHARLSEENQLRWMDLHVTAEARLAVQAEALETLAQEWAAGKVEDTFRHRHLDDGVIYTPYRAAAKRLREVLAALRTTAEGT